MNAHTVTDLLLTLATDPFIGKVAEDLLPVAAKHGNPRLPTGPRTEIEDPNVPLRTEQTIGDWGGDEAEMAARYNEGLVRLLAVIDLHHAGGNQWVTTHPSGDISESFKQFCDDAFSLIEQFVTDTAWDSFLVTYL